LSRRTETKHATSIGKRSARISSAPWADGTVTASAPVWSHPQFIARGGTKNLSSLVGKAEIPAKFDTAIARIDNDLEKFRAENERWQEKANQRRWQIEAEAKLRAIARQIGFEGSVTLTA